jgi:L-cystine transport system permease protein
MKIDINAITTAFKAAIPYIPVTLRLALVPLLIGTAVGLIIASAYFSEIFLWNNYGR